MYSPTGPQYPFAPARGMGQACPSMSQLLGITDPTDPCQQIGTTFNTAGSQSCFNNFTGTTVACPVAGTTVAAPPSSQGPFASIMPGITNLNWGVLAAVLVGLVVVAGVTSK